MIKDFEKIEEISKDYQSDTEFDKTSLITLEGDFI